MNEIENYGRRSACELVENVIFPKVVTYLKERFPGSNITVKELMGLFGEENAESVATVSNFRTSSSRPPSALRSKAPSISKKNESELIREKPEEGVRCIHIYVRGPKKDTYCGKPCVEGLNYCRYCKNKKKTRNGNSKKSAESKKTKKKEEKILEVSKYYDLEHYYIQAETNFVVFEDNETICAVAKELGERDIRVLTPEEKTEAKKYDLVFIADVDKEQEAISSLKKLLGAEEEEEIEETLEDISPKPIPTEEEPLITKATIPVIPIVPEVPTI